ncbi:RNase A-like domain-containing protein [Terrarubrum flagellatum]|uniref:RNase A-like domain-containing protein n=1 Tax=Terrirubrum flagellatum TaxID=2895980 RepID=UPI003144DD88
MLAAKAYNPDQPRVPAGHPDGGQWMDAGFHLLRPRYDPGQREEGENVRVAGEGGDAGRYQVNLNDEEAPKGIGHTIRRHVGQTDAELMARMRLDWSKVQTPNLRIIHYAEAYGSFTSTIQANDFVNQVLRDNKEKVDAVANGDVEDIALEKRFGYPTGKEAYRPDGEFESYIRTTYCVRVVIEHDGRSSRGYRVRTAMPVNQR